MSANRKWLAAHVEAALVIEKLGLVIDVLEGTRGAEVTAQRCITQCKNEQQRQLRRLDASAAKLGAPYGRSAAASETPK